MNYLKWCVTLLYAAISTTLIGQSTLVGSILSDQGEPLYGAYLHHQMSNDHAHTDLLGKFTLSDRQVGDTIVVSYIGYEQYDWIIKDADFSTPIEIVLIEGDVLLDQVQVTGAMRATSQITSIDLRTRPVKSSQEILQHVPGLFIAQHGGGGKAEQIFLRGFDIDHGTDVAIRVDGMPVNMVSHAHGQGYSDLHFVIPETIKNIEFGKGPYYSEIGNFGTAGYVDFTTKDKIKDNLVSLEYGRFDTRRVVSMIDLLGQTKNQSAYVAAEYMFSDGPFESPQNFNRFNALAKYNRDLGDGSRLTLQASHFTSRWDASGQIPQRLVDEGVITRFGSVDDTEGGETSRTNISLRHTKSIGDHSLLQSQLYWSKYDFTLYSNFTFFLEDPVNGDQIRQSEDRQIYGFESKYDHTHDLESVRLNHRVGVSLRHDKIDDVELSSTINRNTIKERKAFGDVNETNAAVYAQTEIEIGDFIIIPGLRYDMFGFEYIDHLATQYTSRSTDEGVISPKFNILYNPNPSVQLYLKTGKGFHANDSRVATRNQLETIPAAYGADLGSIWKPSSKIWIDAALWYLHLDQEFVYVGDAAIVEPSGKTRRYGVEFGTRLQLAKHLIADTDATYTIARSIEEPDGQDFIPLAPDLTVSGGLSYIGDQFTFGSRYRYIKDRPANEDNTLTADGYFILDINASYSIGKLTVGLNIENVFDTEWNQAQFATESQLATESSSTEEIHFTPGVPIFVQGQLSYRF